PRMAAARPGCADSAGPTPARPGTGLAPVSSAGQLRGAAPATPGGEEHWGLGAPDVLVPSKDPAVAEAERLSAQGLRVLLLARASSVDAEEAPGVVHPVCLVVLDQKVRQDAAPTLDYFDSQGVDVKIVSGDHAASVGAVGRALGLRGAGHPVDTQELPDDQDELARRVEEIGRAHV